MMAAASFLYLSKNSSAPEKAIWLMYFSISSAVIPIPRSLKVSVPFSLSMLTETFSSPNSPLNSPTEANVFNFCVASTAFETNSRTKISWSLYKNFLIMGKMLSVVTPMFPFCIVVYFFGFEYEYYLAVCSLNIPIQILCQNSETDKKGQNYFILTFFLLFTSCYIFCYQ